MTMHSFASRQSQGRQRPSSDLAPLHRPAPAENQKVALRHHSQRSIGNQAIQRLLQANSEMRKESSATNRFDYDFGRIQVLSRPSKTFQTKPAINECGEAYERDADHMSAPVARLPTTKASIVSRPAMQRKCTACESGGGLCAECAKEEKHEPTMRAIRLVSTARSETRERAVLTKAKERNGSDGEKPDKGGPTEKTKEKPPEEKAPETKKEEATKCPKETITISGAKCGDEYGAVAKYCYEGASGWWFKEHVKNGPGPLCQSGNIDQTSTPFQSQNPCVADKIFDNNGPPKKVAPCTDTTFQTVFIGPTKDKVEQCQYKHTQVITVTVTKDSNPKSGKVITNAGGASTECAWTS
jgi:hypothetical protein